MNAIKTHDRALREIVRRLVELYQPERVYLFGSKARGEDDEDSDYDLLLVVSSSDEPGYQRAQRAQRALWGLWEPVDVLVLTREEFDRKLSVACSLASTVVGEGTLLYAA